MRIIRKHSLLASLACTLFVVFGILFALASKGVMAESGRKNGSHRQTAKPSQKEETRKKSVGASPSKKISDKRSGTLHRKPHSSPRKPHDRDWDVVIYTPVGTDARPDDIVVNQNQLRSAAVYRTLRAKRIANQKVLRRVLGSRATKYRTRLAVVNTVTVTVAIRGDDGFDHNMPAGTGDILTALPGNTTPISKRRGVALTYRVYDVTYNSSRTAIMTELTVHMPGTTAQTTDWIKRFDGRNGVETGRYDTEFMITFDPDVVPAGTHLIWIDVERNNMSGSPLHGPPCQIYVTK